MKSSLLLCLVLAGLATGCALEDIDSRQQGLAGGNYHPNRLGHDAFTDLIAARL